MNAQLFITFALLGIGRNLPFQGLYVFGLGAADIAFGLLLFRLTLDSNGRINLQEAVHALRLPIVSMLILSTAAMTSMAINSFRYGVEARDIFEIFRYSYHLVIAVVTYVCTRRSGALPALAFAVGVIGSAIVAYLNPMNPDVLGTPQIFNPNVIGNVLAASIVLSALTIMDGHPFSGSMSATVAALLSFFTFSKGTWLMSILGLIACYLALRSMKDKGSGVALTVGKYVAYVVFASFVYVAYESWETISLVMEAKIAATEFESSAAEGGSFAARWGLILSAVHMFLANPLFGVGISNFETVNNLLQGELGDAYYDDDNPNSAWFYVLGCMGLPAFICFGTVFVWFISRVSRLSLGTRTADLIFYACVAGVFLIGGSVQLEMLTAYYYWVTIGIVAATQSRRLHPLGLAIVDPPYKPTPLVNIEAQATRTNTQ